MDTVKTGIKIALISFATFVLYIPEKYDLFERKTHKKCNDGRIALVCPVKNYYVKSKNEDIFSDSFHLKITNIDKVLNSDLYYPDNIVNIHTILGFAIPKGRDIWGNYNLNKKLLTIKDQLR